MSDLDPMTADAVDMARDSLPVFLVAESPDGPVYSHHDGFPDDDTAVWTATDETERPLGELYAQFGEDLVAYAEPEEAAVTAAVVSDPDALEQVEAVGDGSAVADGPGLLPLIDTHDEDGTPIPVEYDTPPDQQAVRAALINQAGADAMAEIEAFLDIAEQQVAVTASMGAPNEGGTLSRTTMRMAVGENPTAQQAVKDAFEAHYDPDVNRFIFTVLGLRPDDNEAHDGEAWDALDHEARLWHAKRVAVAAALSVKEVEQRERAARASADKRRGRRAAEFAREVAAERAAADAEGRPVKMTISDDDYDSLSEELVQEGAKITRHIGGKAVTVLLRNGTVVELTRGDKSAV